MKRILPLTNPRLAPERVRDRIRQELNRFSRRHHRRPVPEGFDQWFFDCKIGPSEEGARPRDFKDLGAVVDELAQGGAAEVYIEINVRAGHRAPGATAT